MGTPELSDAVLWLEDAGNFISRPPASTLIQRGFFTFKKDHEYAASTDRCYLCHTATELIVIEEEI